MGTANTSAPLKVSMFGFLKKRSPALPSPSHPDSQKSALMSTYKPSTVSVSTHDLRLELVRTVLKDTVRHHGLPADWLRAELTVPTGASANGPLHIRIIMTKWNGTLLKYTMALERLILTGMDRYDPAVDHSGYTVSWQFAKNCVCPFPTLPPPETWVKKKNPAPKTAVTEDFFDRRKQALHAGSTKDGAPRAPISTQDTAPPPFAETTLSQP